MEWVKLKKRKMSQIKGKIIKVVKIRHAINDQI